MTEFYIEILKFFVGIIIIFFVLVILPICVKYRKSTYFNDTKKSIIKLAFDVGAYGEYRIYKHLKHYEKQLSILSFSNSAALERSRTFL